MKAVMVMFDSLNRHLLSAYGCDWTHTPNFARLATKTVKFTNAFVGSMPCMPARREIHTGRYNFLHRAWGPLEPFDDSMPQILKENGVYTHLVTDHYHYWEDGGATYMTRYSSYENIRGQEGDYWKGEVAEPDTTPRPGRWRREHLVNRKYLQCEEDQPQAGTFRQGLEFIETNKDEDNWFLTIETFDPHEPFFSCQKYKDLYPHDYKGPEFYYPETGPATEPPDQVEHIRYEYAALLSMCDAYLGKVLDAFDKHNLWKDTMLIVNTDHGYLLDEYGYWGKSYLPWYNHLANMPFFVWDPRCGCCNVERNALVQTIDIAPTLMEYFGVDRPADMQGHPLRDTIANDTPVREAALFGLFGAHVNCTDGRYVYMRAPVDPSSAPLFNYTLMTTRIRGFFKPHELKEATLSEPFSFSKDCPLLRVPSPGRRSTTSAQCSSISNPIPANCIPSPTPQPKSA